MQYIEDVKGGKSRKTKIRGGSIEDQIPWTTSGIYPDEGMTSEDWDKLHDELNKLTGITGPDDLKGKIMNTNLRFF